MAATRGKLASSLLVSLALFISTTSTEHVPVLIWSADRIPALSSSAAGSILSQGQFSAYLSTILGSGPHTVVLFLQDKLSLDDLTVFGGVFGNQQDSSFPNLQAALKSSHSSSIPAVECSGKSEMVSLLQEKLGVSPLLVDADTLAHLSLRTSVNNLLLIQLPYCGSSGRSCRELLLSNDEIMGEVLRDMTRRGVPYVSVFSGLRSSRVSSGPALSGSMGRSLLQSPEPGVKPPIMFNVTGAPCIMLWAQNLNVRFSAAQGWVDLASQTPSLTGSSCSSTSSVLVLSYPAGVTLRFFMSQRYYRVSARNWFTLDAVQLQANSSMKSFVGSRGVYAPAEYSFHCMAVSSLQDALLVPNNTVQNTSEWAVTFVDFQIQGFGLANGTNFSYANDCAGFFTAGIWMGLLTSLLMLLIFVYGLHMIMQLNTMDRFDDPKGPSISVPQSE
ncbi:V-type proton ATPase subunit S1b [Neosynchiropus ocellatus]